MTSRRIWLSWSSGKDSAFALGVLRREPGLTVAGLLTTVTAPFQRVSMHGVRRALLRAQAEAVGLPLCEVEIPSPCPNEVYESAMAAALQRARGEGVTGIAFGDLYLAEIRAYRERMLFGTGIDPLFPLWGRPTAALAREMIASGLQATITCLDPSKLDPSCAGASFDAALLARLPSKVDPCGEQGEFHTFAWDGPMFHDPVKVRKGEVVQRDGFVFCDLLPA